ncbi:hypothetical protein SAMN04487968_10548 [Nocardioides terrae]|uniref:DUF4386 family protein n=1 Tax=Nocardioides terrae TaxID=574651 RepID=A0A1I1I2W2_9ACTN|nr:hypothetical protein [Nocardioides terrae]SFC28558.1 hypothetical protein SAMN04487968_10548 [Nocardioides terrae]
MSITTHHPARDDVREGRFGEGAPTASRSRLWSLAGIGAGLAGFATIAISSSISAVYDAKLQGDAPAIADKLADLTPNMFVFHSVTALGALLMVVFGVGLAARLRAGSGRDSIAPLVAVAGLVGTAVVSILGSGLDTEFMMTLSSQPEAIIPESAVMYNHWVGTIPWLWTLAGLAGLATYAVSRRGGVPRWIGRVGLVLGGLTVLLGVSPLEYMAGATGALMVLVTAVGFTVGDKHYRQ